MRIKTKEDRRARIKHRIRKRVQGNETRPRLTVFPYVRQVRDDTRNSVRGAVTLTLGVGPCYESPMCNLSYHRHRFPAEVIQYAVWLYFRFPLSFRDVEDLLAQRGIDVSYETVRRWSVKFGLAYARKLRRSHPPADTRWHLDEVFVSINGRNMYLWRAVEGRTETDAETAQGTGLRSNRSRDGQTAILWCRAERSRNERQTHHGRTKQ